MVSKHTPNIEVLYFEFEFLTYNTLFATRLSLPLSLCYKYVKVEVSWVIHLMLKERSKFTFGFLPLSLSLSLPPCVLHFVVVDFFFWLYLMLWGRIESVELKTFLHVMVKNIYRWKKEEEEAKFISAENCISAKIT